MLIGIINNFLLIFIKKERKMLLQKRVFFFCCGYQTVTIKKDKVHKMRCPNCGQLVGSEKFIGKINRIINREIIRHPLRSG
jgi:hypothetical protein